MSYQNKSSSRIYPVITYLVLFGVFILVVSPLQWAIASSFSQNDLIFRNVFPFSWKAFVPSQFTMEAYQALFTQRDFGLVLRNTFILSIGTVLLSGLINLLAGFAFATFDFNGKNLLFGLVLFTFMVPIEVTIIPQYLQMKNLGWINTWQGLVLFISTWNAFFWPLVVAPSPEFRVIQVAISLTVEQRQTIWNELFAGSLLAAIVPILIVLPLQQYYVNSIASTGIKE